MRPEMLCPDCVGQTSCQSCRGARWLPKCPDCGKAQGSFACKIRHLQLNTGAAKAARD